MVRRVSDLMTAIDDGDTVMRLDWDDGPWYGVVEGGRVHVRERWIVPCDEWTEITPEWGGCLTSQWCGECNRIHHACECTHGDMSREN